MILGYGSMELIGSMEHKMREGCPAYVMISQHAEAGRVDESLHFSK